MGTGGAATDARHHIGPDSRIRERQGSVYGAFIDPQLVSRLTSDVVFAFLVTEEGVVTPEWVGGAHHHLTGYSVAELADLGLTSWEPLIHPDDKGRWQAAREEVLRGRQVIDEYRLITKGGDHRWVRVTSIPEQTGGRTTRIVGSAVDITEQRRAEERYTAVAELVSDVAFELRVVDSPGELVWATGSLEKVTGYRPEEWWEHGWRLLITPDDHDVVEAVFERAILGTESETDARILTKSGELRWIHLSARPVVEDGQVVRVLAAAQDITERHRMEAALRQSEERYRSLVELSPFPIVIQRGGVFVYANPAAAEFLAADNPDRLLGCQLLDVVVAEHRSAVAARLEELRGHDDEVGRLDLPLVRFDGQVVYAEIRWAPVWFEGEPAAQIVAHDTTEQRLVRMALENALQREREAVDRLREADRVKDAFLTQISHELRTPLTPIVGFALTLRDRIDSIDEPERTQILDILVANADQMARMVERLLDFTQIQAGHLGVHSEPLHLAETVRHIVDGLKPLTYEHQVEIDIPEHVVVSADPGGLDRVLGNLVANAVKYAPPRTVIRVKAELGDDVVMTVEDEGPGIPSDLAVFERFVQGPEQPAGHHGTGVGLAVARAYIELMGGQISAEPTPAHGPRGARGARVRFTLPRSLAGERDALPQP